jgi:hypothetical protein
MSRQLSEAAVVAALGEVICKRLARKLIASIQKMDDCLLSGDDSALKNVWDEICVQIQNEQSHSWDAYDDTVRRLAQVEVDRLRPHEREAIWLQSKEGVDWSYEEESSREPYPVLPHDIVEYLVDKVYTEAANWSNPRIREYLDPVVVTD